MTRLATKLAVKTGFDWYTIVFKSFLKKIEDSCYSKEFFPFKILYSCKSFLAALFFPVLSQRLKKKSFGAYVTRLSRDLLKMIPLAYINVVANNHDRKQGDQASKSKPPRFEANKNHGTGGHTKLFFIWNELDTKLKITGSKFNKSKI